jgi:hypothetical protein
MSSDLRVWMEDHNLLRNYLLGELTEEKVDAVERRLLADDDYFELVEAVEGDLLADCASGALSPREHARVMRGLASTPRGRARLGASRELAILSRERPILRPQPKPIPFPLPRKPAVHFAAMAAMLLAVIGGVWLSRHTVIPGGGAAVVANRTAGALHHLQSPLPNLAPAVLELALSIPRSSVPRATLTVPAGTQRIEIRLPLQEGDDFPSYRATIHDADNATVWQQSDLVAQTDDDGRVVVVGFPASQLPAGTYGLKLSGVGPDRMLELIGQRLFDVRTP